MSADAARIGLVSISDRASTGVYQDAGLPALKEWLGAALLNPAPMALWATLILLITLIGMVTLLLGLVIAVPWLAHASWHAYRDLVEPESTS
jgi:uncharacterized membrane protein